MCNMPFTSRQRLKSRLHSSCLPVLCIVGVGYMRRTRQYVSDYQTWDIDRHAWQVVSCNYIFIFTECFILYIVHLYIDHLYHPKHYLLFFPFNSVNTSIHGLSKPISSALACIYLFQSQMSKPHTIRLTKLEEIHLMSMKKRFIIIPHAKSDVI